MIIDDIIREMQPEVHKILSNKRRRSHRRKNKQYKNHENISFHDIERMMRNNNGVDERECRG